MANWQDEAIQHVDDTPTNNWQSEAVSHENGGLVANPGAPIGTSELQNAAIGTGLKAAEGATLGLVKPAIAYIKSAPEALEALKSAYPGSEASQNPNPFPTAVGKNEKLVNDYFEKYGKAAGGLGTAAEFAGGLAGPAEIEALKGVTGLASGAKDIGYLQKLLDASKNVGNAEKMKGLAKTMGAGAAEGAGIGAIGGFANSDANLVQDKAQVGRDVLGGAKLGAEVGGTLSGVGNLIGGGKYTKKLSDAYKKGLEGETSFGDKAALKAQEQTTDAAEEATKALVGNNATISDLYKAELEQAGKAGKVVEPTTSLMQNSQEIAKTPGYGKSIMQYHKDLMEGNLSPQDAKNYEIAVREMYEKSKNAAIPNPDLTNTLGALQKDLKQGYSATLPPERADALNKLYSTNKSVQQTFLNNGIRAPEPIIDITGAKVTPPNLQRVNASDNFQGGLPAEVNEKMATEIIPNVMRHNPAPSSAAASTLKGYANHAQEAEQNLNNLLQNIAEKEKASGSPLAEKYANAKIDYKVPETLKNIENASSSMVTSGAASGPFRGEGQVGKNIKGAAGLASGGAGSALDWLANRTTEGANIAGRVNQLPNVMGGPFKAAAENPTNSATNAALLKIMSNPAYRKMLGVNPGETHKLDYDHIQNTHNENNNK